MYGSQQKQLLFCLSINPFPSKDIFSSQTLPTSTVEYVFKAHLTGATSYLSNKLGNWGQACCRIPHSVVVLICTSHGKREVIFAVRNMKVSYLTLF